MPQQSVHIKHVIENVYPYSGSLFDKKGNWKEIFAWVLLVSLVVCRATMSIAFTKKKEEEEKKENSIKKKQTKKQL